MNQTFAENPAYREYEAYLVRLHRLIAEGKGDTVDADEVREAMDRIQNQLSEAEVFRLNGLSRDLYMLSGDEILTPLGGRLLARQELVARLQEAHRWHDWGGVLGLLRHRDSTSPQAAAAFSRARAYEALGHIDVSLLFLDHAAQLDPQHKNDLLTLRIMILSKYGRAKAALEAADRVLGYAAAPPIVLIAAADAYFQAGRAAVGDNRVALWHRALSAVDVAVKRGVASDARTRDFFVIAYLLRAACYESFGTPREVIQAVESAVKLAPDDFRLQELLDALKNSTDNGPPSIVLEQTLNDARSLVRSRFAIAA